MKVPSRIIRAGMVLALALVGSVPAHAGPDAKLDQRLKDAESVYKELLTAPDRGVPQALLRDCKCVAVFPHVIKGAMVYGARHGTGVMSCRSQGGWGAPSF